jgi:hypothetical protein
MSADTIAKALGGRKAGAGWIALVTRGVGGKPTGRGHLA